MQSSFSLWNEGIHPPVSPALHPGGVVSASTRQLAEGH